MQVLLTAWLGVSHYLQYLRVDSEVWWPWIWDFAEQATVTENKKNNLKLYKNDKTFILGAVADCNLEYFLMISVENALYMHVATGLPKKWNLLAHWASGFQSFSCPVSSTCISYCTVEPHLWDIPNNWTISISLMYYTCVNSIYHVAEISYDTFFLMLSLLVNDQQTSCPTSILRTPNKLVSALRVIHVHVTEWRLHWTKAL